MNARCLLRTLLIAAGPALSAQAQTAPDAVRQELLALETRWDRAVVEKDIAVLERILAPSFVYVSASGTVSARAQMLDGLRAKSLVIDPFETRDVQVRLYGDVAILTGWYEQTGRVGGQPYRVRSRYTDVYVRDAERWVAVSAHASTMP